METVVIGHCYQLFPLSWRNNCPLPSASGNISATSGKNFLQFWPQRQSLFV